MKKMNFFIHQDDIGLFLFIKKIEKTQLRSVEILDYGQAHTFE